MTSYAYQAVDSAGQPMRGTVAVLNQNEALRRIREMGLFPLKLTERRPERELPAQPSLADRRTKTLANLNRISLPTLERCVKPRTLTVFTRQLATLIDAGMPLLRG